MQNLLTRSFMMIWPFNRQPTPNVDLQLVSDAIKFGAVCSVICSLIWALAILGREFIRRGK